MCQATALAVMECSHYRKFPERQLLKGTRLPDIGSLHLLKRTLLNAMFATKYTIRVPQRCSAHLKASVGFTVLKKAEQTEAEIGKKRHSEVQTLLLS